MAEWSKACDSKSLLLWRRRFKSCHCRFFKEVKRERKEITKKHNKISARVAEWSKALVSGTSLFGGVGSNPTSCILIGNKEGIKRTYKKEANFFKGKGLPIRI